MKRLGTNVGTVVFNDLYFSTKCDILLQIETLNEFACCFHLQEAFKVNLILNVSKTYIFVLKMC